MVGTTAFSGAVHAYRWRGPNQVDNLGVLSTFQRSSALGVSGNGEVVVGVNTRNQPGVSMAFRWTPQTGMQALGYTHPGDFQSEARAVSRDGSTIVGFSSGATLSAFTWTTGGGFTVLPNLQGQIPSSTALGVNFDGSIVVGHSTASQPTIWVDGAVSALGLPAGFAGGLARSVSDTGAIVVGQVQPPQGFNYAAAVWTNLAGGGPQLLTDYLLAQGVQLPAGLSLQDCLAVSADGLTFAGVGSLPGGPAQGFVARVPSVGTALVMAVGAVVHSRRRRP